MQPQTKKRFWPMLKRLVGRWNQDECFLRSAGLAFYAEFSLFPLCLVLLAGFGFVSRFSTSVQLGQEDLISAVEDATSPWLASQLRQILGTVKAGAPLGGPIGLTALLLGAIGIFSQLEAALDRIWDTVPTQHNGIGAAIRSALFDRLTAFLLLIGLGVVLGAVMVTDLILTGMQRYFEDWYLGSFALRIARMLVPPLVYTIVFTTLYKIVPKASVRWPDALRGGCLTAAGWWSGQHLLEWAIIGEKYNAYGVVGAFMAILIWSYYASAAVLLGAEFVRLMSSDDLDTEDLRT